jgi:hypothetical protein
LHPDLQESIVPAVEADPQTGLDVPALTRAMAKGDEAAYAKFYDAYFERLRRYLLVVTAGNEDAAREALQSGLVRVVRHIRQFESDEVFWGWLTVLARPLYSIKPANGGGIFRFSIDSRATPRRFRRRKLNQTQNCSNSSKPVSPSCLPTSENCSNRNISTTLPCRRLPANCKRRKKRSNHAWSAFAENSKPRCSIN